MHAVYDALSAQYPDAKFFKVDIDNAELAGIVNKHAISSVPTFTFYKVGGVVSCYFLCFLAIMLLFDAVSYNYRFLLSVMCSTTVGDVVTCCWIVRL